MAIDIIPEKGGQCSFYSKFPLKSRFLLDFATKKQVVFDTTPFSMEVKHMAKKSRYQDYMAGLKKLSEKKEKNASLHSVLEQLKAYKNQNANGGK